jgi:hypothetical protein
LWLYHFKEKNNYEICAICWWEDDGTDNEDANEPNPGPNYGISLTHARYNFLNSGIYDCMRHDLFEKRCSQANFKQERIFKITDEGILYEDETDWSSSVLNVKRDNSWHLIENLTEIGIKSHKYSKIDIAEIKSIKFDEQRKIIILKAKLLTEKAHGTNSLVIPFTSFTIITMPIISFSSVSKENTGLYSLLFRCNSFEYKFLKTLNLTGRNFDIVEGPESAPL